MSNSSLPKLSPSIIIFVNLVGLKLYLDRPTQPCRVIAAYETAYPDPLILRAGEEVSIGQNDTQWPAYVWCTNQAGQGGWVPESFIERTGERGIARRDYTARELSAAVGDELVIGEEAGGWLWCTNSQGQSGWIPAENVEVIADNIKRKT